ncbi:MAG TPA: Mur ligase domain-containing protein, partial [Anaerolineae bacterium]
MKRVHLIGIGGSGLSAIATLLLESGAAVSGSDAQASAMTDKL